MKCIFSLLMVVILLSLSASAAAGNTTQVMEITDTDDTVVVAVTQPVTFWESPTLRAGESVITDGTLTVTNTTDSSYGLSFRSVTFPYSDSAALEYLNHLHLTVKQEETVLYEGPYSEINTPDALALNTNLAPDESVVYTVSLKCDYTYTGTSFVNDTVLEWNFTVTDLDTATPELPTESFHDPLLRQWLIAGIITVVLLAITLYIRKQKTTV